jgi:lipid A 3-O-deacylase
VAWISSENPEWATDIFDAIRVRDFIEGGRIGFAIGHNIYTPEDTATSNLVTDDRPYAGWLSGAISLNAQRSDVRDTVELDVGVVGPAAFGRQVQNGFHDIIGVGHSNGWGHQLDNEQGVMLVAERQWRTALSRPFGLELDVIPRLGGSLGNVMTFGAGGATFRLGQDLDVDFGPPMIHPSLSGFDALDKRSRISWYVFAGGQVRAVARDIFLDGNTFSDSHSVDKKHFVADAQLRVAVIYEGIRIALTQVLRTRAFEGQRQADRFGASSVSFNF